MSYSVIMSFQLLFFGYFILLQSGYLLLTVLAFQSMSQYMRKTLLTSFPEHFTNIDLPVSLLVPAYNEEATIISSVSALLQLDYPEYEVIVINDGSTDLTLQVLIKAFSLVPFPETNRLRLRSKQVRAIYHSTTHPNLRILDKNNGGKSDALNAGINASRYPLYCSLDADSILQEKSLRRAVVPFHVDSRIIACGVALRVMNGSTFVRGFLAKFGMPQKWLVRIQIIEYLRAFLFGRMGWSSINGILILSGAFSIFRKEEVIEAGGYRVDTVGEDMDLVMRLHYTMRKMRRSYRIVFLPDPVCWTKVPEDLKTLKSQRVRWHRGLSESLIFNLGLPLSVHGGVPGWVATPFFLLFEWLSPLVEIAGYLFFFFTYLIGLISLQSLVFFLLVSLGFSILLSVNVLALEEMSFYFYIRIKDVLILLAAAVAENFGYRQLNALWRLQALWQWIRGAKIKWGDMRRLD